MSSKPIPSTPNLDLAQGFRALPIKTISTAVTEADQEIMERATGVQVGLRSRWDKLNKALMGGHRWNNIYSYNGASGSGKSFFLNMLRQDFHDLTLNSAFQDEFITIAFSFEMSASDEIVRSFSSKIGRGYGEIMSADTPFKDYDKFRPELLKLANAPVFFIETSGNRKQMLATIHAIHLKYPDKKLLITIDHSLLMEFLDERDEIELLSKLAKTCIQIRKNYECLIVLLGQLNDKIEHPLRIQNNSLHYPTKTDIHGGKQLYWACDVVGIIHRPELLGIDSYGKQNLPTKDLIAFHLVKARKGTTGLIRFKQDFAHGQIQQWTV